jgi:hypothetical protein
MTWVRDPRARSAAWVFLRVAQSTRVWATAPGAAEDAGARLKARMLAVADDPN